MRPALVTTLLFVLLAGCAPSADTASDSVDTPMAPDGSFGADVSFLARHTDVVVLQSPDAEARVAIVPAYQGRVMTSTTAGDEGSSLGWINYDLIASGDTLEHINPFGGEDRFWLGPEGGQFSIFFKPGDPFDLEHWQVPAPIDLEPFELVSRTEESASFRHRFELMNYSGTQFVIDVDREIALLGDDAMSSLLGVPVPPDVQSVAYASENRISNAGEEAWTESSGMVSIWILGMFNPSPATTVVVPFVEGPEDDLGPIVNDAYFGQVPEDRLVVGDGVLFFKGDGLYRSKIGLSPARTKPMVGSYDDIDGVLTLVSFDLPEGATRYVNSMWEIQDEPFAGDVVNSYNDGPPEPGADPLGPFYELETSSPAAALQPGESLTHVHRTLHFAGTEADLDSLAQAALGVTLQQIRSAFD